MEGKSPGIHLRGGWVGCRPGLETLEKRESLAATGNRTMIRWPTARTLEYAIQLSSITIKE
jgi:hypothetical protein